MGTFDFFRKKIIDDQTDVNNPLGDLEKTNIIDNLVQIATEKRDETWVVNFLYNIVDAAFRCGDPQVIQGPDGFPYFNLLLPIPNQQFDTFVIRDMKDNFLLEHGLGIVFNLNETQPDWVFTYGDIVNLAINKTFFTSDDEFFTKDDPGLNILENKTEILIGQPNEYILPEYLRNNLRKFLKANGIEDPKVLIMQTVNDSHKHNNDLVFNILPEQFPNEEAYKNLMNSIAWFLPRHYSFLSIHNKELDTHFENL